MGARAAVPFTFRCRLVTAMVASKCSLRFGIFNLICWGSLEIKGESGLSRDLCVCGCGRRLEGEGKDVIGCGVFCVW